uniref:Uncharacterized protein n=1 Tax=Triticum urartu TaxID=4572 RepID=A0A8R7TTN2_TRIUA
MMRRADPCRASETAARSSMARTRSGPRRPNQVCLLPQLSRFTGDLPRTTMTSDPFSLICSGDRLSHHRRRVLNAKIRRAKAKLLEEDPPKLHAGHSPPPPVNLLRPRTSPPAKATSSRGFASSSQSSRPRRAILVARGGGGAPASSPPARGPVAASSSPPSERGQIKDVVLGGVALEDEQREKFNQIQ